MYSRKRCPEEHQILDEIGECTCQEGWVDSAYYRGCCDKGNHSIYFCIHV